MQQTYQEEILLCILKIGSKMDAVQIIRRFGNRVLDQNNFIYLIRALNDKIPQSEIEKFYSSILIQFQAQAITAFILNELLRKGSQMYAQKQSNITLKTPEDIFHLIQKSIKAKNQEIERVFRIFDTDRDCMLNEQEFKIFVEYYVPAILPEEFRKLKLAYPSKNVTLFELMTWMQETSAMRNSIKVVEKANQPQGGVTEKPKIYQKPQEQQKQQIPEVHPILNKQQPSIPKPNIQNVQPQKNVPPQQPLQPQPQQQRQINPVLESILYEDPNQANILQSEIQFQNYVILDYNLPGVQDFLKIFNDLYKKKLQYTDYEFQAIPQSLGTRLQQYQWKRLGLIWPDYEIFVKDVTQSRFGLGKWISPKDIRQGELGDCYFLSTLSSMACRWPDTLLDLFLTQKRNPCGVYAVRLCIDGIWKAIILDDQIPTKYESPAFSQSQSKEIWVILLEKAWAKSFGSYSNIISGESREVMRALTGGPTWSLRMEQKDFKEQFTGCIARKCLMTTGTQSAGKNQQLMGLIPDHAYSILKIRKIKHPSKGEVTLIKLRNPWGKKEWSGEWSDDSKSWTQEIKTQLRVSEKAEDGIFYMSYEDFVNYFCTVYVGYFKQKYIYSSLQVISKAKKSLYFTFDIPEAGEYYISAIQQSSRHFKEKYANYEYSPIRIMLGYQPKQGFEFEEGKQEIDQEVYVGGILEKGKYMMQVKVKWLFWNEHNFTISSYGEKQVKIKQIQKSQEFVQQVMIQKARQNNQMKPLSKDCSTIMTCAEMSPSTGIGYEYYKNNGNQTLELTCQYLKMTGLKLKKPERGNSYQVKLEPGKEKIVLVSIDPKGFSQQQQRSYILR